MPSVITLEGSKKKMKQKADVPKKGTERCIFNPRTGRGHPQVLLQGRSAFGVVVGDQRGRARQPVLGRNLENVPRVVLDQPLRVVNLPHQIQPAVGVHRPCLPHERVDETEVH